MKNTKEDVLQQKIKTPFLPPERYGWLRKWVDESPHASLSALVILGILLSVFLVGTPGRHPLTGDPTIETVPVRLGETLEAGKLDQSTDATSTAELAGATRTPEAIQDLDVDVPTGPAPVLKPDLPVTGSVDPGKTGDKLDGLMRILGQPKRLGGNQLAGIFQIKPEFKSVVYVIDKSSSMGADQRLERVKAELIFGIQSLNKDQRFTVVFFDSEAQEHSNKLLAATASNKDKAAAWVRAIPSSGGTDPVAAMEMALQKNPKLIMLLSDGEFSPTAVTIIGNANVKKQTQIDCIGLAELVATLQQIADGNGGKYYPAR